MRRRLHAIKVEPSPLAGKLFDPSGACLTPRHGRKGERRYRYSTSRGTDDRPHAPGSRWLAPARPRDRADGSRSRSPTSPAAGIGTLRERRSPSRLSSTRCTKAVETTRAWSGKLRSSSEAVAARATDEPAIAAAVEDAGVAANRIPSILEFLVTTPVSA